VIATAGPSAALQARIEHAAQQMGIDEPNGGEAEPSEASPGTDDEAGTPDPTPRKPSLAAYCWAMLLARIYDELPLLCPRCSEPMKIIAFITERDSLLPLLENIGEDANPPTLSPARGPPQAELDLDQTLGAVDEQDIDQSAGLPEDHWA
jgi:hypothetical protein